MEMSGDNDNSAEEEEMEKAARKRKTTQLKVQNKSTTCCSDGESNGRDISSCKEGDDDSKALNLNGNTRASRGAATDPQSLYARVIFLHRFTYEGFDLYKSIKSSVFSNA